MQEMYAADMPFFKALLIPHRSLGRAGFFSLIVVVATVWLTLGAIFLRMGAWPVFGFFGLDVLALYIAFRVNYQAMNAREEIALSHTELHIRKTAPFGRVEEYRFNPFGLRFRIQRHSEAGITGMAIEQRDQRVIIGALLHPEARERFAAEFGNALAAAKRH